MTKPFKVLGSLVLIVLGSALIAACAGATPNVTATPSGPQNFTWDHSPTAAIFQMSRALSDEPHSYALNRLPLCTLFGDGRLIWTTFAPQNGQQVLQTTLNDTDARAFLTYVVNDQHFFSIPDYVAHLPTPGTSYSTDTMAIALTQGNYTARSYGGWPNNEYQPLLDKCSHLADNPTPYEPTGGWLTVEPLTGTTNDSLINWGDAQPIQFGALSGKPPVWISGDLLQTIWRILRRSSGAVQWQENNVAYRVSLQIPNLSPGAPSAPSITPTPFPSVTPSLTPTRGFYVPPATLPKFVTQIPVGSPTVAATSSAAPAATSAATP